MPGFLLHQNAQVQCPHGGMAFPTAPMPRVTVSGMPVTTMPPQWVVSGCGGPSPPGPCVVAQWITSAMRVQVQGQPVLLFDSQAITNNGSPLFVVSTQSRVQGT